MSTYDTITFEHNDRTALVTINRPDSLNALNQEVMSEVAHVFGEIDRNKDIAVSVLTGEGRAFAAGADIKEMQPQSFSDMYVDDFFGLWDRFAACRKPVIAAVNGFALGGGCELAMMCDMIIASEKAKFGQPEINLGTIPGGGGTQRLPRFIGKSKAMDMCLTGRMMGADEAERCGLVTRVVPVDKLMEEAIAVAETIAEKSLPIAMICKESVNRAFETTLAEGVRFERRLFHSTFATEDKMEGMAAFVEKRAPAFQHR
jgi:enoyl-CoA hydratase